MTPNKFHRVSRTSTSKRSRWLWFVGLWIAGMVGLMVIAYLLRSIMSAIGMTI